MKQFWKQFGSFLKVKHTSTRWSIHSTSRYLSKKIKESICSWKNVSKTIHSSLFCSCQKFQQLKCPWRVEWVLKMWYIHKMDHYSGIKINYWYLQCVQSNYSEWKKPYENKRIYWFHFLKNYGKCKLNYSNRKLRNGYLWMRWKWREVGVSQVAWGNSILI